MRHLFLLLVLSASTSNAQIDSAAFREGRASHPEEYCFGLYSEIEEISTYISRIDQIRVELPSERRVNEVADSCILGIHICRADLSRNSLGEWPKSEFLVVLVRSWLDKVESMFTEKLKPVAKLLSRPVEQWNAAEIKLEEQWIRALEHFKDFDENLKDFMWEFAEANSFEAYYIYDPLSETMEENTDFEIASESFRQGRASDGQEFYAGLLAEIILVDVAYRTMEELDADDAPAEEIHAMIDKCLEYIHASKMAIASYDENRWPKQKTFNLLSFAWLEGIAGMLENYAKPLAEAMAKPDDDWTDEEYAIYESWQAAYDVFLEVDNNWVMFQHEYAEANGFTLNEETINVDALIEK